MTYLVFVAGTLDSIHSTLDDAEMRVSEITSKYAWMDPEKIHILEKQGLTNFNPYDIIST